MKDQTKIIVLLDKSASMMYDGDKTMEGFNGFLQEQRETEGDATISLYQFADELEVTYLNMPVKSKQALALSRWVYVDGKETQAGYLYNPSGRSTSLRDAIGSVIETTGVELSVLPEGERPNKVIIVIITDGHDNSSVEFSLSKIKEMITHQQQVYNWKFLYLGADVSSTVEAKSYGININTIASYEGTRNIGNAFKGAATYTSLSRTSVKAVDISLYDTVNDIKNK
jgi:hypothetical protein